jgi:hypothetical protein
VEGRLCHVVHCARTREVDRNAGIEERGRTVAQHIRSSARGTCARPCDPTRSSVTPCLYPRPRRPPVPLPPAAVAARVAGCDLLPGMTILPALLQAEPRAPAPRPTAAALLGCGSPSFFCSCFVIVGPDGGGPLTSPTTARACRCPYLHPHPRDCAGAASSSPSDEHNLSNVRFTERKPGASGDGKRDAGGEICAGVPGVGAVARVACANAGLALGLGLMRRAGEAGASEDDEATGASHTSGKPLCRPRRLQIDEKCSHSWYLMRSRVQGRLTRRGWAPGRRRRRRRIRQIRASGPCSCPCFCSCLFQPPARATGARLVVVGVHIRDVRVLRHGGREGHDGIWCCLNDVDQLWLDDLDVAAGQVRAIAKPHVPVVRACTSTDFMSFQKQ